jgi:hypothetical protein
MLGIVTPHTIDAPYRKKRGAPRHDRGGRLMER